MAQQAFRNATVHYSSIIPKKVDKSIRTCDKINGMIRQLCEFKGNKFNYIDTRGLFVKNGGIRYERLSQRDKLHLNREGIMVMGKHLKYSIHAVQEAPPPPYSPS